MFTSAAPLATSFSSSLAWVITKIGDRIPIASWRLLSLVEGFPSTIVSFLVFLYIPDNPGTARYLTRRQQKLAKWRLRKDLAGHEAGKGGLKWDGIRKSLIDPKSYLTAVRSAHGKTCFVLMSVRRQCSSAPMSPSAPCPSFYQPSSKNLLTLSICPACSDL